MLPASRAGFAHSSRARHSPGDAARRRRQPALRGPARDPASHCAARSGVRADGRVRARSRRGRRGRRAHRGRERPRRNAHPRRRRYHAARRAFARRPRGADSRRQPRAARLPHVLWPGSSRRGARALRARRLPCRDPDAARGARADDSWRRGTQLARAERRRPAQGRLRSSGEASRPRRWCGRRRLRRRRCHHLDPDLINRVQSVGRWACRSPDPASDHYAADLPAHPRDPAAGRAGGLRGDRAGGRWAGRASGDDRWPGGNDVRAWRFSGRAARAGLGRSRALLRNHVLFRAPAQARLGRATRARRGRVVLTELRIRNFAIIESLTLPLAPGFNVLSGETGAGKSIIVGALGLLLGERASSELIRTGADRAVVEGVFDVADKAEVAQMLDERGIDLEEGRVVLRREVAVAGRTRAWINDTTTTAAALAEIGRGLVNLHGQHEAQTLLDEESQRRILDAFGGATEQAATVGASYRALADITREIETLASRRAEAERRADYLRHVVNEIDDARLREGEDVTLEEEARRLENAEELRSSAAGMVSAIEGSDEAVLHALANVQRSLAHVQKIDATASRLQELFDSAFYALEELSRQLSEYEESIDLDPARLIEVQRRRDLLFRLTKKYGPTVADALRVAREAREELSLVDGAGFDLKTLELRREEARARLAEDAKRLTTLRTTAAERLSRAVDEVLPGLGMAEGHFTVNLRSRESIQSTGAEDV